MILLIKVKLSNTYLEKKIVDLLDWLPYDKIFKKMKINLNLRSFVVYPLKSFIHGLIEDLRALK